MDVSLTLRTLWPEKESDIEKWTSAYKSSSTSETWQDRTTEMTVEDQLVSPLHAIDCCQNQRQIKSALGGYYALCFKTCTMVLFFYRAMHFSAKRGIAIACRLSVCLSVCNVGEL